MRGKTQIEAVKVEGQTGRKERRKWATRGEKKNVKKEDGTH